MKYDDWDFPWKKEVGSRKMTIPATTFDVKDFGAVGDGAANDTAAIQNALDSAEAAGGGVVTFPPGVYLSGSVFIGNNTELNLPKGATIWGIQEIEQYRRIRTRVAGIETTWPAALLNVIGKENVIISGTGTIDGRGKIFWDDFWEKVNSYYEPNGLRWAADYDCQRPRGILVQESRNVEVKDAVIYRAGFWSVHILYSQYVTVRGLCIFNNIEGHGPSTDGIDIDSSEYILVEQCRIDCNDDIICLKAGRDADGLRVNRKTQFVLIRDCHSGIGGGLIVFGSETSGGISHVMAERCKACGTAAAVAFKGAVIRGGGVHSCYFRDIELEKTWHVVHFNFTWLPEYCYPRLPEKFHSKEIPQLWKTLLAPVDPARGIPKFFGLHFRNLRGKRVQGDMLLVRGHQEITIQEVTIQDCCFSGKCAGHLEGIENWKLENVSFEQVEKPLTFGERISSLSMKHVTCNGLALSLDSTMQLKDGKGD